MAEAKRDGNHVPTLLGVSNADGVTPVVLWADPVTHRLLVDLASGSGTVTSVSVVTANGFAGTVATATTTPAITLTTTVTGVLKGNGTAISAATAGTDYTSLAFKTISVSGQSDVVADTPEDTLTLVAGTNITITTNAGADSVTINASGGGTPGGSDTQVQFNDAGSFGGDAGLVYDKTTDLLTVAGDVSVGDDLLLTSSGAVINFNAGDVTVTHSSNLLTLAGGSLLFTADLNAYFGDTDHYLRYDSGEGKLWMSAGADNKILKLTYGGASGYMQIDQFGQGEVARFAGARLTLQRGFIGNEAGEDSDTRIEGDTDQNLLFLDASADFIGIGNAAPAVKLDVTGEIRASTAGTNSASVVTVGGTQTLTNKTLTSPAINTPTLGGHETMLENAAFLYDPALSADGKYNGFVRAGTAGATLAFGDLIYLDPTDSRWELADANAAAGADGDSRGVLGICVLAAAADGDPTVVLLNGIVRADTAFPTFTVNNPVYVSETAGDVTGTQPTTTDVVIRIVGVGLTGDELYFNPDQTWITHT